MPYSKILSRSFEIVRNEPALWVLGFIYALFGGGGSGGSGGGGGSGSNFSVGSGDMGNLPRVEGMPWLNAETILPIILAVVCFLFLLSILAFVVQNVALAGLIHGANRSSEGEDVHWGDLWRAGWSHRGVRLIGMKLLLALPILLGVLLLVGLGALVAVGVAPSFAGSEPGAGVIGVIFGAVGLILCLVLAMLVVVWALSLIGNYAARAIVLEDRPVMASIRHGWRLLRANPADSFVFSIILGVIGLVISFVIGIVMIAALVIMGIPIFLLLAAQEFPLWLTVGLVVPGVILLILVSAALSGPLQAYFETAWTLVWQHLTRGELASGEVAAEPA